MVAKLMWNDLILSVIYIHISESFTPVTTCKCIAIRFVYFKKKLTQGTLYGQLFLDTVKPVLRGHSKRRPKIGFQD